MNKFENIDLSLLESKLPNQPLKINNSTLELIRRANNLVEEITEELPSTKLRKMAMEVREKRRKEIESSNEFLIITQKIADAAADGRFKIDIGFPTSIAKDEVDLAVIRSILEGDGFKILESSWGLLPNYEKHEFAHSLFMKVSWE